MKINILLLLFFSIGAQANICNRNIQIVSALEKVLKKKCDLLTIQDIEKIKQLDLIKKKITDLKSSDLDGFTSLEWIRLGGNEIATLPDDLFNGTPNLRFLGLSENKITQLSVKTFYPIPKIQKINLDRNLISEMPPHIFNTNSVLQVLSIAKNNLGDISENFFSELPQLTYVNLFENKIPEEKINLMKKKFPKIQIN